MPAMAKGDFLSRRQEGIVKRYYEHKDTLMVQKLAELSAELYLCDSPRKADAMWKRAETALKNTALAPSRIQRIVSDRDIEALAKVVTELS